MDLTSYSGLIAAIAQYLNRTDMTDQIPGFVALAEAEMRRRLRIEETVATVTIAAGANALPADCKELRSMRLISPTPWYGAPVVVGTYEQLAEVQMWHGPSGRPRRAAIYAGELHVSPTPNETYSGEIVYFPTLAALSPSNGTNRVLADAPDAYLYGSLLHSAPYLEHDERAPMWRQMFDAAMLSLEISHDNAEFNASLKEMRLPRVF